MPLGLELFGEALEKGVCLGTFYAKRFKIFTHAIDHRKAKGDKILFGGRGEIGVYPSL